MLLIYTDRTMLMVSHVKNLLEAEGIACIVRNEFLSSGAGELPPTETWPELWVVDDAQAERARALVTEATGEDEVDLGEAWHCPLCKEEIEGNFAQCWNCGATRPG